jgi:hypothetical protein
MRFHTAGNLTLAREVGKRDAGSGCHIFHRISCPFLATPHTSHKPLFVPRLMMVALNSRKLLASDYLSALCAVHAQPPGTYHAPTQNPSEMAGSTPVIPGLPM